MKKLRRICLISVLIWANPTLAQEAQKSVPKTQLEVFLAKTGSILVKTYHPLGLVAGLYGTGAELDAVILFEPGSKASARKGVKVEVKGGGRLEREHTSFLDLDEIESLIKALDYMAKAAGEWGESQADYTEMVYSTKGDFQIGFYVSKGKIQPFVKSGDIVEATAFLQPDGLVSFRQKAEAGLQYLRAN